MQSFVIGIIYILSFTDGDDLTRCPGNLPRNQYTRVHGNSCYEFVIYRHVTWHQASEDCSTKGGNLVTIQDPADQHFLMSALGSLNFNEQGVWIGLSDEETEGNFTWVSGDPLSFTYWGLGQPGLLWTRQRRFLLDSFKFDLPNLGPDEDCVVLKYTDSGHWHDYPCNNLLIIPEYFPYVCEYAMTTITAAPPTTTAQLTTVRTTAPMTPVRTTTLQTTSKITKKTPSNVSTSSSLNHNTITGH